MTGRASDAARRRYVKLHIPHVALFVASRRIVTLTVWGKTLIHWRAAT